ncbi:urease accessory protein UreF [Kineococcus glutinatus]|uniref:Urease accessory protein UreF n=1 Tax=Kineococcus glutinatus TaxID=1070872 RepID=A0ABP9I7R6_9ACTN
MTDGSTTARLSWLQLQDGTFPSGRFVHSNGVEAWLDHHRSAGADDVAALARTHVGALVGPLDAVVLAHAWDATGADDLHDLDRLLTAHKTSASARTASQACGRQLAATALRVFGSALRQEFLLAVTGGRAEGNQAVVEGAVLRDLGVGRTDAVLGFLRSAHAGLLSAAVRLGRLGPIAAQRALFEDGPFLLEVAERSATTVLHDLGSSGPELEIFSMRHERSTARLFTT